MLDFCVLGLPRSATTWLSVWLTTEQSLCLHDPFAQGLPEHWPDDGRRKFGISCTGAYLFPKWLARQDCPTAVIVRDAEACDASLFRMGMGDAKSLQPALERAEGRRFRFEDLWEEETAHELWAFLLPEIRFDALRYQLLKDIQIQPHMSKWRFEPSITTEMQRREAGGY